MMKRLALPVAALAFLAVTMGSATKIHEFCPVGAGLSENPEADGMAVLKFEVRDGTTEFHVVVHDLLPNTTYGVLLLAANQTQLGESNPQAFVTNGEGNAHYRATIPQDLTSQPTVAIFLFISSRDYVNNGVLFVTDPDVRAAGGAGVTCP